MAITSAGRIQYGCTIVLSGLPIKGDIRSIVVPVKAILPNLLSVAATYGIMVLVLQEGVGENLGIFVQFNIIEAWIPLFLFTILFGPSMDYHVFLLSRIRERFDATGDNTRNRWRSAPGLRVG